MAKPGASSVTDVRGLTALVTRNTGGTTYRVEGREGPDDGADQGDDDDHGYDKTRKVLCCMAMAKAVIPKPRKNER